MGYIEYVCICVYRYAHPCIHTERPEINVRCPPQLLSTYFFKVESPSEPGAQKFLSRLATEPQISVSSTQALGSQKHVTTPNSFYVSAGLNVQGLMLT